MVVDWSWRTDLEQWLEPFLVGLSHPARRRMCPLYIAGLIGPGDRKSVQPMAARAGEVGYEQLHHFVAAGIWDSATWRGLCWPEATVWAAAMMHFWSSTTQRSRRKGATRSVSHHNTRLGSARRRTASRCCR